MRVRVKANQSETSTLCRVRATFAVHTMVKKGKKIESRTAKNPREESNPPKQKTIQQKKTTDNFEGDSGHGYTTGKAEKKEPPLLKGGYSKYPAERPK